MILNWWNIPFVLKKKKSLLLDMYSNPKRKKMFLPIYKWLNRTAVSLLTIISDKKTPQSRHDNMLAIYNSRRGIHACFHVNTATL